MRNCSSSPPIHVHVDDAIAVHVHVKSPQGPTHCLEITQPLPEPLPEPGPEPGPEHSQSVLRLADLTSEEEEGLHGRISQYERKIESLLTEVSSLRNEKKEQLLERQSEQLSVSQRVIAEQEEELAEVTEENTRLRLSMEKMLEDTHHDRQQDKDALLRKLVEAEMDGTAAAEQVSALRGSVSGLCVLARQKELLLQKLETFEATNRTLRQLLRDQQGSQVLLKLASFPLLQHLVVKLEEKDREVNQLSKHIDTEKVLIAHTADVSKSLESTRAHLQGQLRSKEAENNRLSVQVKNLERAAHQQKVEVEHLKEQLARRRQQAGADREALKRAARSQKQRAERSEDTADQLSIQLLDTVLWPGHRADCSQTHARHLRSISCCACSRIAALTEQLQTTVDEGWAEREALLHDLHGLTTESSAAQLEKQSLKVTSPLPDQNKLALSQSELQQVRASIQQYESLLDSYKIQVGETRAEADEYRARVAQAEQEAQAVRRALEQEVEEVRSELLGRLAPLEPLPEALRRSDLQLQEARDRERSQERRSMELSTTLTDLCMKVETQSSQVELLRQKNKVLLEENRQLQQRGDSLERSAGTQNTDLLAVLTKREDTIRSSQLHLEEKTRECCLLSQKLEEALGDAHQQMSETRGRAATKERSTQYKILDLEAQLSRTTSEINQLRRSKEEVERRYQSRLQDVKDRLEQSDSTNRSLQNYVQFLKASYANVFGDLALDSSLRAPSPI
uniref:Outer dense fiber protein 2 n=1 Tax=Cyclopterus lumpus TaxID=8103 RepID=A0A8C2WY59_CYCLU